MKIYGHPWSINTRKVLATFAEKGQTAELVLVNLPKGGQHAPEHIARHPFAKAPVLEDNGYMIYESTAILRYLDRVLEGSSLSPGDVRSSGSMDQWISVNASYFEEPAHHLLIEAIFKRVIGIGDPDPDTLRTRQEALDKPLDVIDRWLGSHAYLAGETFSLAEITWMPYLEYLSRLALGRDMITSRKHVAAWWARISERPAWAKVARTGEQPPIGGDVAARA